jgi:hypothetical protein
LRLQTGKQRERKRRERRERRERPEERGLPLVLDAKVA